MSTLDLAITAIVFYGWFFVPALILVFFKNSFGSFTLKGFNNFIIAYLLLALVFMSARMFVMLFFVVLAPAGTKMFAILLSERGAKKIYARLISVLCLFSPMLVFMMQSFIEDVPYEPLWFFLVTFVI